jgi:hypothetical protein
MASQKELNARATMRRVLAACEKHARPIKQLYAPLQAGAPALSDDERLEQQRMAIADVLKPLGMRGSRRTVIEFGAGDGALSRTLWRTGSGSAFVLIDKSKPKMDRLADSQRDGFQPSQLCADVGALQPHVLRDAVADTSECVVLSNHMCGCALDQAVHCALHAFLSDGEQLPEAATTSAYIVGIVAVTCCHHACTRETFLGREFLGDAGLNNADFELVRRWTRMAPRRERPAATRLRVVETAKELGITIDDAAELGSRCRQLMDSGRAHFLEQHGFDVVLANHVPFALTADNVMLLAMRRTMHTGTPSTRPGEGRDAAGRDAVPARVPATAHAAGEEQ